MARDPCLLSNQPTAIAPARPTIAHVQLRDLLVCPRQSGVVNYVVERGIVEQDVNSPRTPTRILARLGFTPNSLTSLSVGVDDTLLAAGGQDKEIHLSYYTPSSSSSTSTSTSKQPAHNLSRNHNSPRIRTRLVWEFEDRLSGSINNSILLTTTSLSLTPSHQSSVEPRVAISNNDGSIRMYDVPLRVQSSRRKLAFVGEVRLDVPINHSSISPDGRTLLSVGDSSKVYLHQITGSSRISFSPIHTLVIPPPSPSSHPSSFYHSHLPYYNANNSLAASFSTAFSGDGSKFAVASQEGVVAVWDVRWTGKPMRVWYTDKSRGGVGGGMSGDGGGMYSAGNGVGGHMNGGASGWLSYSLSYSYPSPSLSASSSFSASGNNTTSYLSDDPWEWTRGTKAPGWCVRSVKFNAGEGARMGREVMAFTEHTSLIHVVDARTFETHDVIRVPTLFNNPSASSGASARGRRRADRERGANANANASGSGSENQTRRRVRVVSRNAEGEGLGEREWGRVSELPVSHARDTSGGTTTSSSTTGPTSSSSSSSTRSSIAHPGSMEVDAGVSGVITSSASSLPSSSSSHTGASRSRPSSRPSSGSRSRTAPAGGRSSRSSPYPHTNPHSHSHTHQPGIVQALGDAFRIALPSSSSSAPSSSAAASSGQGQSQTTTRPRYSPPASIGDSTWRTLGGGNGAASGSGTGTGVGSENSPSASVQQPGATVENAGENTRFRHLFLYGDAPPPGRWSGAGWGGGSPSPAVTSSATTTTTPVTTDESVIERRRRGNVRLGAGVSGNGYGDGDAASAGGSANAISGSRADDELSQNLREWARLAIEEIGSGSSRGVDDGREEEEEEGIVVVPDLGDRDVESEVHALLTGHGISSRLGVIHHGRARSDYEVDEQGEEEEEEQDGMDVDVQELDDEAEEHVGLGGGYVMRVDDNDENEEVADGDEIFREYLLQDEDHDHDEDNEDDDMYDDEVENDDDDDDDIDLFDVECLSAPGSSRTASPGPGPSQRRIRQGTVAEDATTGGYDTFVGGRDAMRSVGRAQGATTASMRYGHGYGNRVLTNTAGAGAVPSTDDHQHTNHAHSREKSRLSSSPPPATETGSASTYGGRRLGYHDDLDLAGLCFDPCGERMYVLGLLPSAFGPGGVGIGGAGGDVGWGMNVGMGDELSEGGGGGVLAGAVVEWSVRGAEKRWWVDESWM